MFKRGRVLKSFLFICLVIGNTSCFNSKDSENSPKKRLAEYISKSFSVKKLSERDELIEFLKGDVKNRLLSWSDEQFREAFIDSKREFLKLVILESKVISETEVEMTYELIYLDRGRGIDGKEHLAKITNKKLCQIVLDQNQWYISDVKNIKELIEHQNELALP